MDPSFARFDLKIKDKKGVKNIVVDYLSCIPNAPVDITPINEDFLDKHILAMCNELWYADIMNYLATGQILSDWSSQDRHHFLLRYGFCYEKSCISSNTVLIKS